MITAAESVMSPNVAMELERTERRTKPAVNREERRRSETDRRRHHAVEPPNGRALAGGAACGAARGSDDGCIAIMVDVLKSPGETLTGSAAVGASSRRARSHDGMKNPFDGDDH